MSKGTCVRALSLLFVLGLMLGCSHVGPAPGNHLVKVGPRPKDVGVVISKLGHHQVFWMSRGTQRKLRIEFRAADFPEEAHGQPPFENGERNRDQVFECNPGGVCRSGQVNPALTYPENGIIYKYWQVFVDEKGNREEADAGIIIEP